MSYDGVARIFLYFDWRFPDFVCFCELKEGRGMGEFRKIIKQGRRRKGRQIEWTSRKLRTVVVPKQS